jgi:DNA-binding NtrC family response regulator
VVTGLRDDLDELAGRSLGTDAPWRVRGERSSVERGAGEELEGTIAVPLGVPLEEVELRLVEETMRRLDGDKQETARVLGIGLRTLYRRLARLKELKGGGEPGAGDES